MDKTYLIFEWDTCDGDTIVHGYVSGNECKVKSVAKRTLRQLKNKLGREQIYYCELPELETNNIDLSDYVVFDHTENAILLTYPCSIKEELEFTIDTCINERELNLADSLVEECYMSDEIDLDEQEKLNKLIDVKRLSLNVSDSFEPRKELNKKLKQMIDTLDDKDMVALNNHLVKLKGERTMDFDGDCYPDLKLYL